MNYNYSKLKNTWVCIRHEKSIIEGYEDPIISMSLPEWNQYVSEGKNVMYPAIKSGRGPNPYMMRGGCGCGGGGRIIF